MGIKTTIEFPSHTVWFEQQKAEGPIECGIIFHETGATMGRLLNVDHVEALSKMIGLSNAS